jgi:hypothetical protein
MQSYISCESLFREWINMKPHGYILSLGHNRSDEHLKLHHSNCIVLNANIVGHGGNSTVMVCSDSSNELVNWARLNFWNEPHFCEACRPDL